MHRFKIRDGYSLRAPDGVRIKVLAGDGYVRAENRTIEGPAEILLDDERAHLSSAVLEYLGHAPEQPEEIAAREAAEAAALEAQEVRP